MDAWIAGGIFLVAYALIASERLDRTLVALFAGLLLIALGVIDQETAFAAIDLNVIFLLAGMMVLASALARTGFFQWLAVHSVRHVTGRPAPAAHHPVRRHGRPLGLPRQRDHGAADDARDAVGGAPAGHLAAALPHQPDPGLQHRWHRDPHRGPAQHPHRLGGGSRLRRLPAEPRAGHPAHLRRLRRGHGGAVPRPPPGPRRAA